MFNTLKGNPPAPQKSLAGDQNAGYAQAIGIWERLPAGPWLSREHHEFEDNLILSISKIVSPNARVRDTGVAMALRAQLVEGGFLTTHPTDDPRVTEYRKVTEAPKPDTRSWEEVQNDHLRQLQAQEAALMAEEADNAERLAKQQRELDPQRGQLIQVLTDLGVVTRDQVRDIVAAEVAAALGRTNSREQ